ncbi:DinB family protein [Paenibacillus flagellatus]|nr:DinB family protein [Paenibacillus flagellatus]
MDLYGMNISYLREKYADIEKRLTAAVGQLSEAQLNWRPAEGDNSIANLIVHLAGNAKQRILANVFGGPDTRDREAEFDETVHASKETLLATIGDTFALLNRALDDLRPDDWERVIDVGGRSMTVFKIMHTIASHFSEHLGQTLYLAKHQLGDAYVTTSVPRTPRGTR